MARTDIDKAQSMIRVLEEQRNMALNQVVQMGGVLDDLRAENAELTAKVEAFDTAEKSEKPAGKKKPA